MTDPAPADLRKQSKPTLARIPRDSHNVKGKKVLSAGTECEDLELSRAIERLEAALIDPTERDDLRERPRRAAHRLRSALVELARAFWTLLIALVARLLLADSIRAFVQEKGAVPGAELTVRAFERLLSHSFYAWVFRPRNILRMSGAAKRHTHEGASVYGLALSSRSYGGSYPGGVETPRVRVAIGVRLIPGPIFTNIFTNIFRRVFRKSPDGAGRGQSEAPVWLVKRFVEVEPGRWRLDTAVEAHGSAEEAMLSFYKDVSVDTLLDRTAAADLRVSAGAGCGRVGASDIVGAAAESKKSSESNVVWGLEEAEEDSEPTGSTAATGAEAA